MEDNEMDAFGKENSDDFGLPEVKYEPLDREEDPGFDEPQYFGREEAEDEEEPEESSNKGLIIFGIISLVIIAMLCIYLFLFGGIEQVSGWFADEPEPEPVTQVIEEPEPLPEPEPEPEPESEVDLLAPYGDITTISEPTGRSYIVVGSFVDDDLARDFSNELMEQEVGSKILTPTNRAPLMHRVAVADYETFNEAINEVPSFRNKYGDQTWVLKY